jgi:hypothetical protein
LISTLEKSGGGGAAAGGVCAKAEPDNAITAATTAILTWCMALPRDDFQMS